MSEEYENKLIELYKEVKSLKEENIKLKKVINTIPYGLKDLGVEAEGLFWDHMEDDKRQKIWHREKLKYGFDTRELWSFDFRCACFIYSRLKFARDFNSYSHLDPKILDDILYAFGQQVLPHYETDEAKCKQTDVEELVKIRKRIRKGFCLFYKYYNSLWN